MNAYTTVGERELPTLVGTHAERMTVRDAYHCRHAIEDGRIGDALVLFGEVSARITLGHGGQIPAGMFKELWLKVDHWQTQLST